MDVVWDESFFERGQIENPVYWICFWTQGDDTTAKHEPVRITDAASIDEVLAWLRENLGSRRYELFVEVVDHAESRDRGWVERRQLVRLAGDFRPPVGASETVTFTLQ